MEKVNVVIAIDDIHPEEGWGIDGDVQIDYLKALNKDYGVKFNLFIPSNYHDKFPITKEFVDFWKQYDWIEMSNHGHYHACKNEGIGEMEFYELNHGEANQRIQESLDLWKSCGYKPKGFRAPGWGVNQQSADAISSYFDWVAGHTDINKGINWGCHFFEGCDGINEPDSLSLYGKTFMFQSHINGTHNDNVLKKTLGKSYTNYNYKKNPNITTMDNGRDKKNKKFYWINENSILFRNRY